MASFNFTCLSTNFAKGIYDFTNTTGDTFKAMLVTVVPSGANQDAWTTRDDVTNEVVPGDYIAGGFACTSTIEAENDTDNSVDIDIDSTATPTYTSVTISAVGAVIYQSNGGVATADPLVCFVDFLGTVSSTAGDYNVDINTNMTIDVG